jgi:hypothetical protein
MNGQRYQTSVGTDDTNMGPVEPVSGSGTGVITLDVEASAMGMMARMIRWMASLKRLKMGRQYRNANK